MPLRSPTSAAWLLALSACGGPADPGDTAAPTAPCAIADAWEDGPDLPLARESAVAVVIGRTLLVAGGWTATGATDDAVALDLDAPDDWTAAAALPGPREHAGAAVDGDRAVVLGGDDGGAARADAWIGDGSGWTAADPLPEPRTVARAAVAGGRLVVAGGGDAGFGPVAAVWVGDTDGTGWIDGPALPEARIGHGMVGIGDDALVLGGDGRDDAVVARVAGGALGDWEPAGTLPEAGLHPAAAVGDRVVLVAGTPSFSGATASRAAWISAPFDGHALTGWTALPDLPKRRYAAAVATDGRWLWAVGGYDDAGALRAESWRLDLCAPR